MNSTSIETSSGLWIDINDPKPGQIRDMDIAHALSNICRFGGQCKEFYSVAQHSVLVYRLMTRETDDKQLHLAALLHDAHEAYLGDIPSPIKPLIGEGFKRIAMNMDKAIASAYDLPGYLFSHLLIKKCDFVALIFEGQNLMPSKAVNRWYHKNALPDMSYLTWVGAMQPTTAKDQFLRCLKNIESE